MEHNQELAQKEMVDAVHAHDDTGKKMREAAANVGVQLERKRIQEAVEELPYVGVIPNVPLKEPLGVVLVDRQAVLNIINQPNEKSV